VKLLNYRDPKIEGKYSNIAVPEGEATIEDEKKEDAKTGNNTDR
jgi:hypothetical protein